MNTIGIQTSSCALGRSTSDAPPPGSRDAPGDGAAARPSASSAAGFPGAIADSSRSKRSTAKRMGPRVLAPPPGAGEPLADSALDAADEGRAPALPDAGAEAEPDG